MRMAFPYGQSLASLNIALILVVEPEPFIPAGAQSLEICSHGRNLCRIALSSREGLCVAGVSLECNRDAVPVFA